MADLEIHVDNETLVSIAGGDEAAFRALYNNFHRQVFNQAYNYLQSSGLASDALQEVFIKIWSARQKLPDVKDIKSFVLILAGNVIINDLK